ncbi:nuclear transport factor 2 family protein [Chloroflexota bacterium]
MSITLEELEKNQKKTESELENTKQNLAATEHVLVEVKKRLSIVEDIEEIKQLHIRYFNALAGLGTLEDAVDCFTENATADVFPVEKIVLNGKVEIANRFHEAFGDLHPSADKPLKPPTDARFIVHPLISVDGDKATGSWIYYHLHSHPRTFQSLFWIQGIYDVEYARDNGKWKFSYLKWRCRMGAQLGTPPYE